LPMTRKLGRLIVVVLVVAVLAAPATLAAAGPFAALPVCGGITYDPAKDSHVLYPTDAGALGEFFSHTSVWEKAPAPIPKAMYLSVDLSDRTGPLVVFPDIAELAKPQWAGRFPGGVRITGTAGDDVICGLAGYDNVINGRRGNDSIYAGGLFFNVLVGGPGNDRIVGAQGVIDGVLGGAGAAPLALCGRQAQ